MNLAILSPKFVTLERLLVSGQILSWSPTSLWHSGGSWLALNKEGCLGAQNGEPLRMVV